MVKRRTRPPTNPVEVAQRKSDAEFVRDYLESSPYWTDEWVHPRTAAKYRLRLSQPAQLTEPELKACFDLIDETSGAAYRASANGWHPDKKMKEMRSKELRYILVLDDSGLVRGFVSLMPTFEEGVPVIYCYEIHLKDELHRTGLGRLLMGFLATIAANIPIMERVMLTCFLSNTAALAFYQNLGFETDENSPVERKLRFGKTFRPDYIILCRRIERNLRPDEMTALGPSSITL